MERYAIIVVAKTTLSQNVDLVAVMDLTQKGLERPKESSLVESVVNVAIRKWTVLNTAKSPMNQIVQAQTQKEFRI